MTDTPSNKPNIENLSDQASVEKATEGTIGKIKIADIKPSESGKGTASLPKLGLGIRG